VQNNREQQLAYMTLGNISMDTHEINQLSMPVRANSQLIESGSDSPDIQCGNDNNNSMDSFEHEYYNEYKMEPLPHVQTRELNRLRSLMPTTQVSTSDQNQIP